MYPFCWPLWWDSRLHWWQWWRLYVAIVWDANSIAYHATELHNYTQSIHTVDFNSIWIQDYSSVCYHLCGHNWINHWETCMSASTYKVCECLLHSASVFKGSWIKIRSWHYAHENHTHTIHASCSSTQFLCANGQCASSSFRCNGLTGGCSDGSDQINCCRSPCSCIHKVTYVYGTLHYIQSQL